jgi:DNA-binding SARP family transcriptional activator
MRDEALPRGGRRAPAPPPALHGEIVRTRLLDRLANRFSVPVTVVVAGAGFGKSTLLAQAIRANQAEPLGLDAWVSCEPGDGDAEHFANAVLAALGRASDRRDPAQRVLDALGQLAPIDVCVLFDDLHELPAGSSGERLLVELVRELPPHAHVVLAGRRQPGVPLARRRAAGQVVDVGVGGLAFTDTEVAALIDLLGQDTTRLDGLAGLAGWPSLVRLALSAPHGSPPQFLWEEVVAALTLDERRALLALATLGWGTTADVETVAGGGPLDLDALAGKVPLIHRDDDGWFGVHQLWEDAVERIFPEVERSAPQRRALSLFQQRGESLRTGWRAVRWGDGEAWRLAARDLVRDTFGALPIDTAQRWLEGVPPAAAGSPERRLLELTLRHARRHDDDGLADEIDAVVDDFDARGDEAGTAEALALGALAAHTRGDGVRLRAIDARAKQLATAAREPVLRFLPGAMEAAVASLRGDVAGAIEAIGGLSFADVPASLTEVITRLHVNMLAFAGRADEAVTAAEPLLTSPSPYVRTIPAHVRWLAGDPSGFAGGRFSADPGAGTNARYLLYHAAYVTAIAASFGDREMLDELRPVIEKCAAASFDRDRAMVALATAIRLIAEHDEPMARRVIADHVDAHGDDDAWADMHLRRTLAPAYVCDERIRARWQRRQLGRTQARMRAVADTLLAARAGELRRDDPLPDAPAVFTALPLTWSVELAARAVAAGCAAGKRLAAGLSDLAPVAMRVDLQHAAAAADRQLSAGATVLLGELPDPSRPPVRIAVLGELDVAVGDRTEPAADLRRRRVRCMLELIVLAGPLRRERLADLMWPELDAAGASRNLRVTMSRLRAVLEPGRGDIGSCAALRIEGDSVSLAPPPCVEVDLWQFRADVAEAEAAQHDGDPAGVMLALERACGRWRGEPFPDVDVTEEIAGAIEVVRRMLTDTALRLGELLLVAGRFQDAAWWAQRVIGASPYDERAHRLAIAAQPQLHDRRAIADAAAGVRSMLAELGVEPEPATGMLLRQADARFAPEPVGRHASSRSGADG